MPRMNNIEKKPRLQAPGWNPGTRAALERLIQQGAGKCLPVAFDFDNTLVCGDVGEATLAMLFRMGKLDPARLPDTLSPTFRPPGGRRWSFRSEADPARYYEALLAPTAHGERDPAPLATGYAWAVEILEGLRPLDVVNATRTVCELARREPSASIAVVPGGAAFPVPVFYPEMVELVGQLLRHGFVVWIFSASNVWSVRWMVLHVLNPLLRERGIAGGMRAGNVVGISTLLRDRGSRLYKDALMVREHEGYAALDPRVLDRFRLTSRLQFPVPTYSGKVACILDQIGQPPYLAAGDSPGDHAMMSFSRHKLWIARLEKPGFQRATIELAERTGRRSWLAQPVLTKQEPGFVSDPGGLDRAGIGLRPDIGESIRLWSTHPSCRRRRRRHPRCS
jgi:phosphoserine phosphatase